MQYERTLHGAVPAPQNRGILIIVTVPSDAPVIGPWATLEWFATAPQAKIKSPPPLWRRLGSANEHRLSNLTLT
jgi:hypothetical protein